MTTPRRVLILGALVLGLAAGLPAAAGAESLQDTILNELHQQGYTRITTTRTLLGRVRIVAESKVFHREIVFNPSTGTILRDYWRRKGGGTTRPDIFNPAGTSQDSTTAGANSSGSTSATTSAADDSPSDGTDSETDDSSE